MIARLAAAALLCFAAAVSSAASSSASPTASFDDTDATRAARRVLADQQAAWNRADLDGFMDGYWKNDDLRFAGGDRFRNGWQETIAHYRKSYPDAAAMGMLDFDLIEVREVTPSYVYVFGKWRLTRANDAADKLPHGLFTLIVEKKDGRWVVTRDHTSAASD